jgi:hypothetical protein
MIQQMDVSNVFASSSMENLNITTTLKKSKINTLFLKKLNTCYNLEVFLYPLYDDHNTLVCIESFHHINVLILEMNIMKANHTLVEFSLSICSNKLI